MATAQEIQAWLAANPTATDRDIAAAMNQYGVSAQDLAGATGWDQGPVADRYAVANAQNYIDTQWGGAPMAAPGNADLRSWGILGATNQMGLSDEQQARALGWTPAAVSAYEQQFAPQVDLYGDIYQHDLTNPASYMQPVVPTVNPASTLGITQPQAAPVQPAPALPQPTAQTPAGRPATSGYGLPPSASGAGGYGTPDRQMAGGGQSFANWNPYMGLMGDDIGRRTQLGLQDAFNQIRGNAVGVGGLGGSRQGVAEGVATGRAMDSLQGQLGSLYGGLWEGAQNRGLNQYGIDTNARLTDQGQQLGFYTQQRGQDLQSIGLGADLFRMGQQGQWSPIQNAASSYQPFTGFGTSTTSGQQGGGWQGALGGALAGATTGRQMGWW